jgi:FeS assembly SUF system protein
MTDKAESRNMPEAPMDADARTQEAPDSAEQQPGRDYLDGFLSDDPATGTTPDAAGNSALEGSSALEERVVEALRSIFDPEIPVNIYDLGLIYKVEADANDNVVVTMTLTTPHCPVAESMPGDVERRVADVEGICAVTVNLVWDPPWDPSRMTEEAQLELGFI